MDSDAAGSRPKRRARTLLGFLPDWAMLDCYLRPLRDSDSSALVYVSTGTGGKIGVDLMSATPPSISYLTYHWIPDEGRRGGSSHKSSELHFWEAKAVAANSSSILLRFLFCTNTGTFPDKSEEFFVYQAALRTLTKLPTCRHTFMNRNTEKNTGILCRESGEFVVAHLTLLTRGRSDCCVTAELCCIFGEEGSWRTTKSVPICRDECGEKDLIWWETDAVVSFGDFICWVDYLRGILLCDVFSPDPEVKYVPLPVNPYQGRCHPHLRIRGSLGAHRSVCVTSNGGAIKFVDVAQDDYWFYGRQQGVPRQHSTIKSWLLTEELLWVEDDMMTEDEFLYLTLDRNLPRSKVECPLVDMRDPKTIYFALEEEPMSCLISVNMKSRTMDVISCQFTSFGSSCMYNNDTSCNLHYHEPFLPLNLEAPNITSSRQALAQARKGLVEVCSLSKIKDNA